MKPFLKRLNERGEALPAAIVTALVSAIILLGAAGMVSYVVQGKSTAEKATLADTTFTSIESQFKTDLTKASKIQPISPTEFRIHTVFQNPANVAQNHCKLINWKVAGNKLERTITFYKGTNPTDVTDCTNSDTMIVSKGAKTLTGKLDTTDTTFSFQNGLGRELSVVGGAVGFKNPNSCALNDEMSATDPECKPVEASVKNAWNLAKTEKVDYILSINNKQRSLSQAPTLALYSAVNPEGNDMGSTALEAVLPTTVRGPANAFVNVPFNVSWDHIECPADTVRSYTLLRDGVAAATTVESSIDTVVPSAVNSARFSVVVNCARGEMLVNSEPSNTMNVGVSIAPPVLNLNAIGNGAPVNVQLTTTAEECAFGTFTWNVARVHDSYQNPTAASTVTGTGRLSMRLNDKVAAYEGTEYQLRASGTCRDAVSGKASTATTKDTERFNTVMNLPTVTSLAFAKTAYLANEVSSIRLNATVTTCPATWDTAVYDAWGRVNTNGSHTMWDATVRALGDGKGAPKTSQFSFYMANTEPSQGTGVVGKITKLDCIRNGVTVSSSNLGTPATATYNLAAPNAVTLNTPAVLAKNATTGNLSWGAAACTSGFSPRYQVVATKVNGDDVSETVTSWGTARTATVAAPKWLTSNSYHVAVKCVGANGIETPVSKSNNVNVDIALPVMKFTAQCPTPMALTAFINSSFRGTVTWEYNGATVKKAMNSATRPSENVPANTPVALTLEGVTTGGSFEGSSILSKVCIQSVDQWDEEVGLTTAQLAFSDLPNLTSVAKPPSNITNFTGMFKNAKSFDQNINSWVTPGVTYSTFGMFEGATSFNNGGATTMWPGVTVTRPESMFSGASAFNQNLDRWTLEGRANAMFKNARAFNNGDTAGASSKALTLNTAAVTHMEELLSGAAVFNQPLGAGFNTAKVQEMGSMFWNAKAFNQPLGANFDTSSVTRMNGMFGGATAYNQPLGSKFDTSKVQNMRNMFQNASSFNSSLGTKFNTANVFDMANMFSGATVFNQPLGALFDTGNVTDMSNMFASTYAFNQPLGTKFNTAKVTNMSRMFYVAPVFNQPLGSLFDTTNVTNTSGMFNGAKAFNRTLGTKFNTAKVTDMNRMFLGATAYNQPFPAVFNTVNVKDMTAMFDTATAFNQNMSHLNTSSLTSYTNYRVRSGIEPVAQQAKWLVVNGTPV